MIATSFLTGSSSNLQITGTDIVMDKFDLKMVWTVGMIVTCP